jgi:hypothetical protein
VVKIVGTTTCHGVSYEADPYTPLTVSWHVRTDGGPLYLYVRGEEYGYVELKVDPNTLALCKLVVIDLPPSTDRNVDPGSYRSGSSSPVLDRTQWKWKTTPDYTEPLRRDADITERLHYSKSRDTFALWFSDARSVRYLACGGAMVGVSADDEMVCVAVPTPPASEPTGYPRQPM